VQVRRERISDRLKALQLLVPNGDKVGSLKKSTRARITTNLRTDELVESLCRTLSNSIKTSGFCASTSTVLVFNTIGLYVF
jgi:hypothetical protein